MSAFRRTDAWFRVFLRFALAAQMFYFGMAKVIPTQFPPPSLVTLLKPVGNLSPDDMLWTFMGASISYQMFTGLAEVAAGVLLVVPRTATIGALIALADMLQVFVLNISYDVGLKQISFHLMAIALFLLAPEARRLAGALVADSSKTTARLRSGQGRRALASRERHEDQNSYFLQRLIAFRSWIRRQSPSATAVPRASCAKSDRLCLGRASS